VLLRLVPFYLARLHGSGDRADPDHVFGPPFPFLRVATTSYMDAAVP
jgi:hypothetical protein